MEETDSIKIFPNTPPIGGERDFIDTHVHFWKYDKVRDAWITDNMKILQQDYLPQTIAGTLRRNGINGCIAVQADQSELELHRDTECIHITCPGHIGV